MLWWLDGSLLRAQKSELQSVLDLWMSLGSLMIGPNLRAVRIKPLRQEKLYLGPRNETRRLIGSIKRTPLIRFQSDSPGEFAAPKTMHRDLSVKSRAISLPLDRVKPSLLAVVGIRLNAVGFSWFSAVIDWVMSTGISQSSWCKTVELTNHIQEATAGTQILGPDWSAITLRTLS